MFARLAHPELVVCPLRWGQLRRAAVSIPTNIAEGSKRTHRQDFARFLNIAEASAAEVESLLLLSVELGFAPLHAPAVLAEIEEIARMLFVLRSRVESEERP